MYVYNDVLVECSKVLINITATITLNLKPEKRVCPTKMKTFKKGGTDT